MKNIRKVGKENFNKNHDNSKKKNVHEDEALAETAKTYKYLLV